MDTANRGSRSSKVPPDRRFLASPTSYVRAYVRMYVQVKPFSSLLRKLENAEGLGTIERLDLRGELANILLL